MGPSDSKKIKIQIEGIETPAGTVPTMESLKKIAGALNTINSEIIETHEEIKKEVITKMEGFEQEMKVFRKMVAEKIISSDSINARLSVLEKEMKENFSNLNTKIETLNASMADLEKKLKIMIADSIHTFLESAGIK